MRFDELLVAWAALGRGDLRPATIRRLLPLLREHGCIGTISAEDTAEGAPNA
jgi:hypothetical protein